MRVIKLAVISIIVLFLVVYLMSLLFPSHVRISRAINIEGSKEQILPLLSDTSNWKQWNDIPTNNFNIKLLSSDANGVKTEWRFGGRTIESSFQLEESAKVTVVQWYFDFHLRWYPWEKFGSITFDKQFGTPMESSLNNLKKLIENSP